MVLSGGIPSSKQHDETNTSTKIAEEPHFGADSQIERRRKWTAEEKAALLAEVAAEGGKVAVSRRKASGTMAKVSAHSSTTPGVLD
jgi:transposase-like protein